MPASIADWIGIAVTFTTACLALLGICIGATGYALREATMIERTVAIVGGALLLAVDPWLDLLGAALLATAIGVHWLRVRSKLTPRTT